MDTLGNDASPGGALPSGYVLGRYTIVRTLGEGGMGAVYEAVHNDLKKRVAVKTLHRVVASDTVVRARFVREAQAASRVRHPHVVDVSDVGVHDELPYLAMELLEGEDLRGRFAREGALDVDALVGLLLPVLAALDAVHAEGIVHRDLKPENIFLARTRDRAVLPKVLDFGISKAVDADRKPGITASASMLGTPLYMAPEQATDARSVDARADLYALGVILYEGLTGSLPYRGDSLFTVLTAASKGGCAPPRSLRPSIPDGLDGVVLRAMSVSASDRFADAPSMARALLPFASPDARARWSLAFGPDPAPVVAPEASTPTLAATLVGGPVMPVTLSNASPSSSKPPPGAPPRARWVVGASALATALVFTAGVSSLASRRPGGVAADRRDAPVGGTRGARRAPAAALVATDAGAAHAVAAPVARVVTAAPAARVVAHGPSKAQPATRPHRGRAPSRPERSDAAARVTSTNDAPIVD